MHIVHLISSLSIGGAERVLCSLVAHLKKTGHIQSIVYIHDGPLRHEIEALGIKTYCITGYIIRYDPFFIFACIALIQKLQPDVIHSSLWAANMLGIIASTYVKKPIVCAIHAQRSVEGSVRNMLDKYILPYANHITVITHTIKKQLVENVQIVPNKITVIENGINSKMAIEQSQASKITRASLSLKDTDYIIGSVGRFVPLKEYPFLINGIAPLLIKNDHMQLILVGVGPELLLLEKLVEQLHISNKVHFIVGKNALDYYHLFDCFVLASTCEALSLVLLESMSLSVPCIVRGNHYRELLEHGTNSSIINTAQELRDAVTLYATQPAASNRISKNAYNLVNTIYAENTMLTAYQALFESIIDTLN